MAFTLYSVSGKDFIGRSEILQELTKELSSKNRIGFSLSGIRRIGKTSILKEVQNQLAKEGIVVIYISMWRILPKTVDELTKILNRTILESFENYLPTKFKFEQLLATGAKALGSFLKNLKLSASVVEDLGVSVSYVRKESNDVEEAINKSFLLIEDLCSMTKRQCVLIIDEFPSIVDLTYGTKNQKIGIGIVQLLRTLFEDFKYTKLVVSGSYRDTLDNLVAKPKAAFYKQLLLREIGPFTQSELEQFLKHYLPKLKFKDNTKDEFFRVTSGIPYNLQLVGKEIQLNDLREINKKNLGKTINNILKKEGDQAFKEFTENLTPSEVKVLKALAKTPKLTPTNVGKQEFLEPDTVSSSFNLLKKKGLLKPVKRGTYEFTDNLFAEWLKNQDSL